MTPPATPHRFNAPSRRTRLLGVAVVTGLVLVGCTPRDVLEEDLAAVEDPAARDALAAELDEQWEPYADVDGPRAYVLGDSQLHEKVAKDEVLAAFADRGWSASVSGLVGTTPETTLVPDGRPLYDAFGIADVQRGGADVLVLSTGMNGILRQHLRPGWDELDEAAIERFVDLALTAYPCVAVAQVTAGYRRADLHDEVALANAFLTELAAERPNVHLVADHDDVLAGERAAFDANVDVDGDGVVDRVAAGGDGIHLGDAPTTSSGRSGQALYAEALADGVAELDGCRRGPGSGLGFVGRGGVPDPGGLLDAATNPRWLDDGVLGFLLSWLTGPWGGDGGWGGWGTDDDGGGTTGPGGRFPGGSTTPWG